ncbi:MAG: Phosphocarrier protein HPr [Calditrichaeota bacterium]|nr:Phosphocarrier protein HPr [Calditrichota bacterium]
MKSQVVTLRNKLGLHARPASHFVKIAGRYRDTKVSIVRDGEVINGKSILGVMMLAAGQGASLEIRCDGPDEETCLAELVELVNNKFYEE